ncbi:MAG: xanthine dehydrogenase accessory protein XdhC [Paracoccaceae bacterium]
MSFDLTALRAAVAEFGQVVRVVVAEVKGSVPREVGAAMLVWQEGQSGTIGGGRLEFDASKAARQMEKGGDWLRVFPLGPALGQCCGGSITLLAEYYDIARVDGLSDEFVLRNIRGDAQAPLAVSNTLKAFRNAGQLIEPMLADGWMLEPVSLTTRDIWVYGAGHVGRAIVGILAALPQFKIIWVDTAKTRYPEIIPNNVTKLVAANPASAACYAPAFSEHLVLTYSHALDLEICHQLLGHKFTTLGLIGSATKWARFKNRLRQLGHTDAQISRITCPIGQPELGKQPQAIAVGVVAGLLSGLQQQTSHEGLMGYGDG